MTLSNSVPFADHLRLASDSEIQKVLKHSIILSLANVSENQFPNDTNKITESELIEIRNQFYIQDYYYLTYGHELVRNILLDRNPNKNFNRRLNIVEPRSPLESTSIENLDNEIKRLRLSLVNTEISATTQKYLIYKIRNALQSIERAIIGDFACIFVYYEIAKYIHSQRTKYALENDYEELSKWVHIFNYNTSLSYYRKYKKVINKLDVSQESKIDLLTSFFVKSCEFEYLFLDALLK